MNTNDSSILSNIYRDIKYIYTKYFKISKSIKLRNKRGVETSTDIAKLTELLDSSFKFNLTDRKKICVENDVSSVVPKVVSKYDEINQDDCDKSETVEFQNRRKKTKLNHVITPNVSAALDRSKTSLRNAVHIISATAKSLNVNLNGIVINRESVRIARKKARSEIATQIKESFTPNCPLTIHWDGKLMDDLNSVAKIERLAVFVTGENISKQLGIPKIPNGTGESQSEAVYNLISEWNIKENIKFICFDTTASNTGVHKGACKLLEKKLKKKLIWLACRHHSMDLLVAKVFSLTVEESTSGPEIQLFQKFKGLWSNIEQQNFSAGVNGIQFYKNIKFEKNNLLTFITQHINVLQPRADYKELLQLCSIFLGKTIENYKFKTPGAMHRARWMSKIIYCIKIFLFRSQLNLDEKIINGVRDFLIFVFKVYITAWFTSTNAICASANDLILLKKIMIMPK